MKTLPKLKTIRINTLREFSLRLGIRLDVLEDAADHIDLHYYNFVKKRGEKERKIYDADHGLRKIHKRIEERILDRFDFPSSIQGGIKGGSLRANAQPHTGQINVGHFDIKNFFPSVKPSRIYNILTGLGCSPDVARLFTRLVTADGHLPQGFGTSTKVAALVLLNADKRITNFLKKYGMRHTIWVDDLAISGSYPIKKLSSAVRKILQQEGFRSHKEEIVYANQRQLVAGVVVNTKPSVRKEVRQEVEDTIFRCERVGIRSYLRETRQRMRVEDFIQKINGRLGNMLAIDGAKYSPLYERWRRIVTA